MTLQERFDRLEADAALLKMDVGGVFTQLQNFMPKGDLADGSMARLQEKADDEKAAEGLAALATSFEECRDAIAKTSAQAESLINAPGSILAHLDSTCNVISQRLTTSMDAMETGYKEATEKVEDFGERAPALAQEKWKALGETVEELREFVFEQSEELWQDAVNEATDAWKDGVEEVLTEQAERFTEVADLLKETVEEALEELRDFAQDELSDTVREEAQKVLETALERLESEVMEGVLTSQVQVQLTSAMAPILPQLIAVRVVAGAIKHALEILRMGF